MHDIFSDVIKTYMRWYNVTFLFLEPMYQCRHPMLVALERNSFTHSHGTGKIHRDMWFCNWFGGDRYAGGTGLVLGTGWHWIGTGGTGWY